MRKFLTQIAIALFLTLVILQILGAVAFGQVVGLQPTPIGLYNWDQVNNLWLQVPNASTANPYPTTPQAFALYGWNATLGQWTPCTTDEPCAVSSAGVAQILAGQHVTVTPSGGTGNVTLNVLWPEFQTNGVDNLAQSPLNFFDSPTIHWNNPSGGEEQAVCTTATSSTLGCSRPDNSTVVVNNGVLSAEIGGALQMQVVPPVTGQYAVIYPTAAAITGDASSQGAGAISTKSAQFSWACTNGLGLCDIAPGWRANWSFSGALEAAGIDPATVTAVYADVWSAVQPINGGMISGGDADLEVTCSGSATNVISHGVMENLQTLTTLTGAQVDTAVCNIAVGSSNADQSGVIVNVPSVRFLVYHTGTPVSTGSFTGIAGPEYLNTATNTLSVDPTWPFPGLNLLSQTKANLPTTPTLNAIYPVNDGISATDCATGGGSYFVLCEWTGSAWTVLGTPPQATVTGHDAGTAVWSQPQQFTTWKIATVWLNGYENTTTTAQTITLPAGFGTVSAVLTDSGTCTGVTISGATVTLPASMGAPQTGLCEIRGW